jgi:hypothetical protein
MARLATSTASAKRCCDRYTAPGTQPPATPNPATVALRQNIQRLKLDVTRHVPIHRRVGTMEEFVKVVGAGTN